MINFYFFNWFVDDLAFGWSYSSPVCFTNCINDQNLTQQILSRHWQRIVFNLSFKLKKLFLARWSAKRADRAFFSSASYAPKIMPTVAHWVFLIGGINGHYRVVGAIERLSKILSGRGAFLAVTVKTRHWQKGQERSIIVHLRRVYRQNKPIMKAKQTVPRNK